MRVTRLCLPHIRDGGHILFTGSVAGRQAYQNAASYVAAKFGLRGFVYALREDLLGRPIRVTTVDGGLVETEFSLVRFKGDAEQAKAVYEGVDPITPDEVADCVMFALTRPLHVNVDEIVIKALAQSSGARVVRRLACLVGAGHLPALPDCGRRTTARSCDYAAPALGALAAEPLYILVDTAIVGHLGRAQLAALGAAATALSVLAMFNFLQYGTTAQVARAVGADERDTAARLGAQSLWLSLGLGVGLTAVVIALAGPIVGAIGVEGETADYASTYLRIVALGLPSAFIALGGQGYLRGIADLRTPLLIVIVGNLLNVVLELLFVYGLDWGIEGSAWGTVVAQTVMGALFVITILRRVGRGRVAPRLALARRLLSVGKFIFVRTAALIAAFILAGAVVARLGDPELAAYQIAFQLWIFLALVLDSIAIAGQIIVGRELGADRARDAYAASVRMVQLSIALGAVFALLLLALVDVLPRVFTSDPAVLEQCRELWPIFALMQPLNGAVFALDGILIGASDGPFIAASMVLAFLVCAGVLVASLARDWGIRGVWVALLVLILVRLATMGLRFRRRKWLVTGFA